MIVEETQPATEIVKEEDEALDEDGLVTAVGKIEATMKPQMISQETQTAAHEREQLKG